MRLFHRTQVPGADVLTAADAFFTALGMATTATALRGRSYSGTLGVARLTVRAEGGHYTFIEVHTDQIGESRLDKNVKRFFVEIHRRDEPTHAMEASY
jgi:hypothetical protein